MHHSGPRDKGVKERSRMEKRKRVEPHGRPITLAVLVLLDACTNVLCFADWLSDNSSPSAKTKRRCLSTRSCRSDVGHFAEWALRPCHRFAVPSRALVVDDLPTSTTSMWLNDCSHFVITKISTKDLAARTFKMIGGRCCRTCLPAFPCH